MFRIVTKNCDGPVFWMVCDHRNCSSTAHIRISLEQMSDAAKFNNCQTAFVTSARKEGWHVVLDSQYCPHCASEIQAATREELERKRALVKPATDADVAKWNGKLVNVKQ